jgi:hypothetical protein
MEELEAEQPLERPAEQPIDQPKRNRPPKAGDFPKGVSGNPYGRNGKPPPELSSDMVPMWEAMRTVASQTADQDTTYQQYELRKWLKKDVKSFMTKLGESERAEMMSRSAGGEPAKSAGPAPVDVGSMMCEELCEKLLGGPAVVLVGKVKDRAELEGLCEKLLREWAAEGRAEPRQG